MRIEKACVFGGQGALGRAVAARLAQQGCRVWKTARKPVRGRNRVLAVDPSVPDGLDPLRQLPQLDIVVWAQGTNTNDSITTVDVEHFRHVMAVNVDFVVKTLAELLALGRLRDGSRLCVIGSIWQRMARAQKLSYTVSKSALWGLIRSAAVDLAHRRILVNGVLPGVVDTPMTRGVLSLEQQRRILSETPLGQLTRTSDVAYVVWSLVSPENRALTGQCVTVDGGFSICKTV